MDTNANSAKIRRGMACPSSGHCQRLAAAAQAAGYPVTIKVYAHAHHSLDSDRPGRYVAARVNSASPTGRGATTGGNPAAWAASIRDVLAFFAGHLK